MRYYTVISVVFGFIEPTVNESDLPTKNRIKAMRISAARDIAALMKQFRSLWPVECVPGTAMQYSSIVMFTLLEDLEDAQNKQAFIESFIVLRALARRWQLAKGFLRLVQVTAMQMGAALPMETQVLFKDFEAELWKAEDSGRFSSLYPNFAVAVDQRNSRWHTDEPELDQILASLENLNLSEQATE